MQKAQISVLPMLLALALPIGTQAAGFALTKIADTTIPFPGTAANFTAFPAPPALSGGLAAFTAIGADGSQGIVTYDNAAGNLALVVNQATAIPGGIGNFTGFGPPSVSQGQLVFRGLDSQAREGVYTTVAGIPSVVADGATLIPGRTETFSAVGDPVISQGKIVFRGMHASNGAMGVYTSSHGALSLVADKSANLAVGGPVQSFGAPAVSGGQVAFSGQATTLSVIVNLTPGLPSRLVADTQTPVPGGSGNFTGFAYEGVAVDNGLVAFKGYGIDGQQGIYLWANGVLSVVANTATGVPDGSANYTQFGTPSLDNGHVAFWAADTSGKSALYTDLSGSLASVSKTGDTLDGRVVRHLALGQTGLSGGTLAFCAIFDETARACEAVYLATPQ